jgi:hypothetical protein
LVQLFYYADEKYNFSERVISDPEMLRITSDIMPHIVEDNMREFLAAKFGLAESIIEEKDYNIDCCLLKFNRPEIVAEIKWKETISEKDIQRAAETLNKVSAKRRLFFVPDKASIKSKIDCGLEIVDISDFI